MNESTERRIECESGKLLARACASGIKLWCEKHQREELFTWGQLEDVRRVLNPPDVRVALSDHTSVLAANVLY